MTIVLSAAYLLSHPCNSHPGTFLSNSAGNSPTVPTVCILRPRILYRVSRINGFKEGLTIKREQIE